MAASSDHEHNEQRKHWLRGWIAEHPTPSARELAEAGLVAPHWPEPWGLAADPELQSRK